MQNLIKYLLNKGIFEYDDSQIIAPLNDVHFFWTHITLYAAGHIDTGRYRDNAKVMKEIHDCYAEKMVQYCKI